MKSDNPIKVGEVVTYLSKNRKRVIGHVLKVNRVNSKVQVYSIGGDLVFRPIVAVVYKNHLRRADAEQRQFFYDPISNDLPM